MELQHAINRFARHNDFDVIHDHTGVLGLALGSLLRTPIVQKSTGKLFALDVVRFSGQEEGAGMADFFVWVTTRRIREGTLDDLRRAWEPPEPPEGMTEAFEWVSDDGRTVIGVSHWTSEDACERYRASDTEAERRERMAPYVESEDSQTYSGRELAIPRT